MENNVKVVLGIFFLELETDSPFKNGKGIPEIATEKEYLSRKCLFYGENLGKVCIGWNL